MDSISTVLLSGFILAALIGAWFVRHQKMRNISLEDLSGRRIWSRVEVNIPNVKIDVALASKHLTLYYSRESNCDCHERITVSSSRREGDIKAFFHSGRVTEASVDGVDHSPRHCEWAYELRAIAREHLPFKVEKSQLVAS